MPQSVAVCYIVLQYIAVYCSVSAILSRETKALLPTTMNLNVPHSVAVCCSVLQCIAVCQYCSVSAILSRTTWALLPTTLYSQCAVECRSVLRCVPVRCSILQCENVYIYTYVHKHELFVRQPWIYNVSQMVAVCGVCYSVLQYIALYCSAVAILSRTTCAHLPTTSALQCVAVGCSGLQCVAVYSVLRIAVYSRVLQWVCDSFTNDMSQPSKNPKLTICAESYKVLLSFAVCCIVLQCVAVCCSVLTVFPRTTRAHFPTTCNSQCVVGCCSVLQCVAVCCSVNR